MINYPRNWQEIGLEVSLRSLQDAIEEAIVDCGVRNLSLSGGIDSTLLLYFMNKMLIGKISCYTIALNEEHPDYINAKIAAKYFNVELHPYFLNENKQPDEIVKTFYALLNKDGITKIIAGDGIDEFTCGYYHHMQDPSEQNYVSWLRRLNPEQLTPLNTNSGEVAVYLPYLSPKVVSLLSLIPCYEKVDSSHRKKVIVGMAQGKIPEGIINRRKYGFCDAGKIK
jgi:asparagine synthetase B (glutamine-hydrolysing)